MDKPIRIDQYLDSEGKITRLPRKPAPKLVLLTYLAERFEPGRLYTEPEINALCDANHTFNDYFLLRRELVESGLLCRKRDGSQYWRAPLAAPERIAAQDGITEPQPSNVEPTATPE